MTIRYCTGGSEKISDQMPPIAIGTRYSVDLSTALKETKPNFKQILFPAGIVADIKFYIFCNEIRKLNDIKMLLSLGSLGCCQSMPPLFYSQTGC